MCIRLRACRKTGSWTQIRTAQRRRKRKAVLIRKNSRREEGAGKAGIPGVYEGDHAEENLALQMLKAFLTGGVICVIGQVILNYCQSLGMEKDIAGSWCSLLLILLSVLLTGFSIYQVIAAWGGAGALVPITGFANSVASPAIEYKAEGQVYGIGVKIFSIAGPVILYGVFTSGILGFFYWIGKLLGWV